MQKSAPLFLLLSASCALPNDPSEEPVMDWELSEGCEGALKACPRFHQRPLGRVQSNSVTEASGLAASRAHPGVLWTHNDSGGGPVLYAMTFSGESLGRYRIANARARDWEDLAIGPGPVAGRSYLYIGDIGGNTARNEVQVYRVAEPNVGTSQSLAETTVGDVATITLRYPNGARYNAETLMIDPRSRKLLIVTKDRSGGPSRVFVKEAPHEDGSTTTLVELVRMRLGIVVSGSISPDGDEILIKGSKTYLWRRPRGTSLLDALSDKPCMFQSAPGEAIAFSSDGQDYFTVAEGSHKPIYVFERGKSGD
jgi:hypothetical protein